jgi:hypothetical protein
VHLDDRHVGEVADVGDLDLDGVGAGGGHGRSSVLAVGRLG